jgi:hypothetical protein
MPEKAQTPARLLFDIDAFHSVTTRKPADGREVVGHLALALSRYLPDSRADGLWMPPEVESVATLLADCVRPRQEETTFDGTGDPPHDGVMDTPLLT